MIDREGLEQILHFVSKRWVDITREPDNKAMKSIDIRIGNWYNEFGIPKQATAEMILRLSEIEASGKLAIDVSPITLTDEWFYAFGFKPHDKGGDCGFWEKLPLQIFYYDDNKGYYLYEYTLEISYDDNKGYYLYEHTLEIEYVHQLQNLYSDKTGEELIYNQPLI